MDRQEKLGKCTIYDISCCKWEGRFYFSISGELKKIWYHRRTFRILADGRKQKNKIEFTGILRTRRERFLDYENNEARFVLSFGCAESVETLEIAYYDNQEKRFVSILTWNHSDISAMAAPFPFLAEKLEGYIFEKERMLSVQGRIFLEGFSGSVVDAVLDGNPCRCRLGESCAHQPRFSLKGAQEAEDDRITLYLYLPLEAEGTITISARGKGRQEERSAERLTEKSTAVLELKEEEWKKAFAPKLLYDFHELDIRLKIAQIRMWALCTDGSQPEIEVLNQEGQKLKCRIRQVLRTDVSNYLWESEENAFFGYLVFIKCSENDEITLIVRNPQTGERASKKYQIAEYRKQRTAGALTERELQIRQEYQEFLLSHVPGEEELARQRRDRFDDMPVISILVPAYRTPKKYLADLVECLIRQTYPNWQLCLVDASMEDGSVEKMIKKYSKGEDRILYKKLKENLGISENTNAALDMATGEYIGLLDHDDILTADALYEVAKAIYEKDRPDVIYTDEDKVDMEGKVFFDPNFKPDFNLELLRTCNYITHFFVAKTGLAKEAGGFRPEYDGSQDYDFILRCTERAAHIFHVPKVLYHWRCHMESTALNPESKQYAFLAGARAVEAHYQRCGIDAAMSQVEQYGFYEPEFHLEHMPKVTLMVVAVRGVDVKQDDFSRLSYPGLEVTYIAPRSVEDFNEGIRDCSGEYVVVVTDEVILDDSDIVEKMLGYCVQDPIGLCAPMICDKFYRFIYGGVIFGWRDFLGYAFLGQDIDEARYSDRALATQNYYAVDGPVFMTSKQLFQNLGGMSRDVPPALALIDYCLKLNEAGYRIVWTPTVRARLDADGVAGIKDSDKEIFKNKWKKYFCKPDPHYNPNYSLKNDLFHYKSVEEG